MSVTTTWSIDWMQVSTQPVEGFDEVVLTAGWRLNGEDGEYTTSAYGTCSFPQPAEGGSFTPYADLTQDQVLSWVWENGVDKDAAEVSVISQVEALANPPVVQPPLPWESQPEA